MASEPKKVTSLIAWVADDGGVLGMKNAFGVMVPLLAPEYQRDGMDAVKPTLEKIATEVGTKIRLVRFDFAEQLDVTEGGE